jgi:carbonyl reductase 1
MSYNRIAAVTGANKGIGLAIVRQLALQYPQSSFNDGPLLIYLTARNQERGAAALESIAHDSQLKKAKALKQDGGLAEVKYHALDIDNTKSIDDFAAFLKKEHPEGIDIVVNNAGILMDGFGKVFCTQSC